jgi:hypothetical protein
MEEYINLFEDQYRDIFNTYTSKDGVSVSLVIVLGLERENPHTNEF